MTLSYIVPNLSSEALDEQIYIRYNFQKILQISAAAEVEEIEITDEIENWNIEL